MNLRIKTAAAFTLMLATGFGIQGNPVTLRQLSGEWHTESREMQDEQPADAAAQAKQEFARPLSDTRGHKFSTVTPLSHSGTMLKMSGERTMATALSETTDAAPRRAPGSVKTGTMIARNIDKQGTVYPAVMNLSAGAAEGTWSLSNFFGLSGSNPVILKIDAAAGTVSIDCQTVTTVSGYGDLKICAVGQTGNGWGYNPSIPVTGTIDDSGNIRMQPWGLLITEGDMAGETMVICPNSTWLAANTSFTSTDYQDKTATYDGVLIPASDTQALLYNLSGTFGEELKVNLCPDKTIRIYPQLVATIDGNDYYFYNADVEEEMVYTELPVLLTATDTGYRTGSWCAALRTNPWGGMGLLVKATDIATTIKLTCPEAPQITFKGSGTADDPYIIATAADFQALAYSVAQGNSYEGKKFILAGDIDMTGVDHNPVGEMEKPFCGQLDGKGHSVKGLNISKPVLYAGLFGYLGLYGSVSNLNISDAVIASSSKYIGVLAGYSEGSVTNVHVSATVKADGFMAGGITSGSEGYISKCSFTGTLDGAGATGGIAGYNFGIITDCRVAADLGIHDWLSATYCDIGGIAGTNVSIHNHRYPALIQNCSVTGSLVDYLGGANMGGIAGRVHNSSVKHCFNAALIQAQRRTTSFHNYTGGIAAWTLDASVTDCFNSGTIQKTGYASPFVGGIVGWVGWEQYLGTGGAEYKQPSYITNCYNSGQVISSSTAPYKGVYGVIYGSSVLDPVTEMIRNCWFDNQISVFTDSRFGRDTEFFTSGTLPEGYSSDVWTATAGRYPILKGMEQNPGALVASLPIGLAKGQTIRKVMSDVTLPAADGVIWTLVYNGQPSSETPSLVLADNRLSLKKKYAIDLLAAVGDQGATIKYIQLGIVPKVFEGEGTAESPYLIKNAADLAILDEAVAVCDHAGDTFSIVADLDMSQTPAFKGIGFGNYNGVFSGILKGNGHAIHNLSIDATTAPTSTGYYTSAGLVSHLGAAGEIHDLSIAADASLKFHSYSGAFTGDCGGLVRNCRNYAPITSVEEYAGGIAGGLDTSGRVVSCYNEGDITVATSGAGGIVGANLGNVTGCQNAGKIMAGRNYAGGIVANNGGSLADCANLADVSAVASRAGGIAGNTTSSEGAGHVANSISYGITDCGDVLTCGGGIGSGNTISKVENNYYDASVNVVGAVENVPFQGMTPMSSADLTSGTPLAGYDTGIWSFAAGRYPLLRAFDSEPASLRLASNFLVFNTGVNRNNITADVAIASTDGVTWQLDNGASFSIADGKLKVTIPESAISNDKITAKAGDNAFKAIPLKALPVIFAGNGSLEDPFRITSKEDLDKLSDFVASSNMDYDGYHFKVMNDINYNSAALKPIMGVRFQGDFDGNGKTISNYVVNSTTMQFTGMFEYLGEKGYLHDLTLDGTFISSKNGISAFVGDSYGRIAGCINRTIVGANQQASGIVRLIGPGASVRDCRNEAKVYTTRGTNAAGIAWSLGNAAGGAEMSGCINTGEITAGNSTRQNYAAGIVGEVKSGSTLSDCENRGAVSGKQYVAGIANKNDGMISRSVNHGTLACTNGYTGGIISELQGNGSLEYCSNETDIDISANSFGAAGIAAKLNGSHSGHILGCVNRGDISAKTSAAGICGSSGAGILIDSCTNYGNIKTVQVTSNVYAGGIATQLTANRSYPIMVRNCRNMGDVTGSGSCVGGIVGKGYDNVTIDSCLNTGNVHNSNAAQYYAGGIIGDQDKTVITNTINAGKVTSAGYCVGGIAGKTGGGTIDHCLNIGNVTAAKPSNNGSAGGLTPYTTSNSTVTNSVNSGNVKAPHRVGGLIGACQYKSTVTNLLNTGWVEADSITEKHPSHHAFWCFNDNPDYAERVSNLYYDATAARFRGVPDSHEAVHGMTTADLSALDLADTFDNAADAYPILKSMANNGYAQLAASAVIPAKEDRLDDVNTALRLSQLPLVTWSWSDNLTVNDGNTVVADKPCQGWLKAEYNVDGNTLASKTFDVSISKITTGCDDLRMDVKEVVETIYYDLNGFIITKPSKGETVIMRRTYTDGTSASFKVIF